MKKFIKNNKSQKVDCINLDAHKVLEEHTISAKHGKEGMTLHNDEDCAFGKLQWFLNTDNCQRQKQFFKY